jgi:hypothetical protein
MLQLLDFGLKIMIQVDHFCLEFMWAISDLELKLMQELVGFRLMVML